jgi:hypothetical protein
MPVTLPTNHRVVATPVVTSSLSQRGEARKAGKASGPVGAKSLSSSSSPSGSVRPNISPRTTLPPSLHAVLVARKSPDIHAVKHALGQRICAGQSHLRWPPSALLACDDDRRAKRLGAWWQIAHPVFSRVLIAQHRRGFGVGRHHQEGLIAVASTAVDTVDGPLPGRIGDSLSLRIDQATKGLRLHTQEHLLLRAQSRQHTFHGDPLTHCGAMVRRGNTRGGGCCGCAR